MARLPTTLIAGVQRTISLLRPGAVDVSTEGGRARERHRRVALTALARAFVRALGVLVSLITVPLTVNYLGPERYGLWMTISSFIALLSFADLGMGSGLLNSIAHAHGRDDVNAVRRAVSSAAFMLLAVASLMGIGVLIAYPVVPWHRLFNVSSPEAIADAGPSVLVLAACFLMNIPLGIVERVRMGYQEGFSSSIWSGLGLLLSLGGVLAAIYLEADLPWLILAISGGPLLAMLLNGIALFGIQRPDIRPTLKLFDRDTARRLLQVGLLFLVLQISISLTLASQNIVIAQILDAEAVTQYSVPFKLFSIPGALLTLILLPLWPAYGEAISRGDATWAKRTLNRILRITFVFGLVCAFALLVAGRQILHLWVGPEIDPPFMLLLGLAAWVVLNAVGNSIAMFLNGAHVVRFQVACAISVAIVALLLNVLITSRVGVSGAIWGTVIAYSACAIVPYFIYLPRLLRRLEESPSRKREAKSSDSRTADQQSAGFA